MYRIVRNGGLTDHSCKISVAFNVLNTLLKIRHAMSRLLVRSSTKVQIGERYTYFYVKKLPHEKSCSNKVLRNCKICFPSIP